MVPRDIPECFGVFQDTFLEEADDKIGLWSEQVASASSRYCRKLQFPSSFKKVSPSPKWYGYWIKWMNQSCLCSHTQAAWRVLVATNLKMSLKTAAVLVLRDWGQRAETMLQDCQFSDLFHAEIFAVSLGKKPEAIHVESLETTQLLLQLGSVGPFCLSAVLKAVLTGGSYSYDPGYGILPALGLRRGCRRNAFRSWFP